MNTVYVITIIIVMFISIIGTIINNIGKEKKESKPNKTCLYIIIVILIIISGFRNLSYIRGDEFNYRHTFDRIVILKQKVIDKDTDIGFWFLNYILTLFTKNNQALIWICAIITNFLIVKNLYKYSNYFNFTLFLYITLGIYLGSFNIMRQYLAAAILFQGINYVIDKKMFKYIICVLIAASFHFSALIMLPMYWIVHIKNKKKLYFIISIIGIIFFIAFSPIIGKLGVLFNKLLSYQEQYESRELRVSVIRILVIVLPIFLMITQYKKIISKDPKLEIMFVYSFINMIFMLCSYKYLYISRLYPYFGLYDIILIPELIYLIKNQKNRIIILLIIYILYFTFGYIDAGQGSHEYRTNNGMIVEPISIFSNR